MNRKATAMEQEPNEVKDFDILDAFVILVILILIARNLNAGGSLAVAVPLIPLYFAQHAFRHTKFFKHFIDGLYDNKKTEVFGKIGTQVLLPPQRDDQSIALRQTKPLDVNVVNGGTTFFQRMTNPTIGDDTSVLTGVIERNTDAKQTQAILQGIRRLPPYLKYTDLPAPPAKLAVPIGIDSTTKQLIWADFGNDLDIKILHAIIAGYTGSGKDAILRLWFAVLTMNNTPEELQFVILDGKVDWLSPALAESVYMAIPPTGGLDVQKIEGKWKDCAKDNMEGSFEWMFEELHRRQKAYMKVGAVDMTSYERKTGIKLPYIFFIASDAGDMFNDQFKLLVNQLIAKGRAYGVRLIISMQNTVGEGTKWRSQVGLVMTGHQPNPDHDRYILGINKEHIIFRPSFLPNPEENAVSRGLFVVRRGSTQHLVRTPHLPEEDWFTYIETVMKTRGDYKTSKDISFLDQLLLAPPVPKANVVHIPKKPIPSKPVLTLDQIKLVRDAVRVGKQKTDIMINVLKITSGDRYKEVSPAVDLIIQKARLLQ